MKECETVVFDEKTNEALYKGLKALSESSFPKRCAMCGKTFESLESFIQETESIKGHTGLKKGQDDEDRDIVQLFRNCTCGSTLMDCFNDRRDLSESGLKRRALFEKLLNMLTAKGLEVSVARGELLRLMRGETSPILEKMGIKTRKC